MTVRAPIRPERGLPILSTIRLRPAGRPHLARLLPTCLGAQQREPGCLGIETHTGFDAPLDVVVVERWRGPEAVASHLASPRVRPPSPTAGRRIPGDSPRALACEAA